MFADRPTDGLLARLAAAEDDLQLLQWRFSCDAMPMWLFVRFWLMARLLRKHLEPVNGQPQRPIVPPRDRRYWRHAVNDSILRRRHPVDVLMLTSSGGLVRDDAGEPYRDRIHDGFVEALAQRTLVSEWSVRNAFRRPRAIADVCTSDALERVASIAARVSPLQKVDARAIDALAQHATRRLELDEATAVQVRTHLRGVAVRLRVQRVLWRHVLDQLAPRLVVFEDGCYGAHSHFVRWTNASGIATAEFQHGVMHRAHAAYQQPAALMEDAEYRAGLPAHLLLWGHAWQHQVKVPSRCTVVGHPWFETLRTRATGPRSAPEVLLISQGEPTASFLVSLAETLAHVLPDRLLTLRLHPREALSPENQLRAAAIRRLRVNQQESVYPILLRRPDVIGPASTALFEAAALGCRVFVMETELARLVTPRTLGRWFSSPDQLLGLMEDPLPAPFDGEAHFASNGVDRYRAFLRDEAGVRGV